MTKRDQYFYQAVTYAYPDEIPMLVGVLPSMWLHYGEELVRFAEQYPDLIFVPDLSNKDNYIPVTHRVGSYKDAWGCTWSNAKEGMFSIVTGHPVPNREDILSLKIPEIDDGGLPHGLMYLRLLDLRGFEEAMIDFAEECDELQILIDKVLEYNCRQIKVRLQDHDDLILQFADDLGTQTSLAVSPEKWRKYLVPCFKKMFSIARGAGKMVYLHTDGRIVDIIPDLVECGVDILNPEVKTNGLDNLERLCKGKTPLCLETDSQMFPYATPSALDDHIREIVETLYLPQGGLALKIYLNYDVPLQNAAALMDAARKYQSYRN
jgi:hypothetical protein